VPDASAERRDRPSVLVIGAGSAGLVAAFALRRGGCEVHVIERGERAGGRLAGDRIDGFWIDRSLPLLSTADRHLLRWIADLGLRDACLPLRPVEVAQARARDVRPIDDATLAGLARIPGLRRRDALRALRLPRLMRRYRPRLDPEAPERAARWDDRSVADFARLYFGRGGLERWIGPAAAALASDDPREISRVAWLLHRVEGEGALLGVPRSGLGEVAGQALRSLPVATGVEAERVQSAAGGGFRVDVRTRAGERVAEADAVVLATGAASAGIVAGDALVTAERDFLRASETLPVFTVCLALERPAAARTRWIRVPPAEDSCLAAVLLETGGSDGRAPRNCGLLTATTTGCFAAAQRGVPDDVVSKALLEAVERLLPGVGGSVRFARLERGGSLPRFGVGSYRRLERFRRVGADLRARGRRLYFAGDWLAGPRLEHAAAAAERAALAALEELRTGQRGG
jgi:protoporphyrinogen/coproporphyrinogen III oxidase